MRTIEKLRRALVAEHFTEAEIIAVLGSARGNLSRISRMVKKGEIVRVRNGLFVFGPEYQQQEVNLFTLGNLVYGPSYVSLESALSFYGFIPEAVENVTGITCKRPKRFQTPLATFLYRSISSEAFSLGITWQTLRSARYLIASPEKAILDKVLLDGSGTNVLDYLEQSLRIERESLCSLNMKALQELAAAYGNARLKSRILTFAEELEAQL